MPGYPQIELGRTIARPYFRDLVQFTRQCDKLESLGLRIDLTDEIEYTDADQAASAAFPSQLTKLHVGSSWIDNVSDLGRVMQHEFPELKRLEWSGQLDEEECTMWSELAAILKANL